MLEVKDLHVSYGQSEVIHGLDFVANKNETLAIMGRNGMGKTTLFKSLVGILGAGKGSISVDGVNVTGMESYQRVMSGIAYVPQGRMIFPTLSVKENIETGMEVSKLKKSLMIFLPCFLCCMKCGTVKAVTFLAASSNS